MRRPTFEQFLWVMPAAYAIHIPEEFLTGFPAWMATHMHASMDAQGFMLNNALFMAILLSVSLWASKTRSALPAFVHLSWASGNLFWNFIFHLWTTVQADSYSPGLVSATLLYYPISIWAGVLAVKERRLTPGAVFGAFAIGAGLMLFVIWAGLWRFHLPFA
ncbi:MAG: HXXEE domain-containing protein [Magnetospirillum gryphiswaldense]|uniref:HXXEE domain-containing protein n=1 Tax=Magnetospirillum sp. 64-120 TaxID=1895778 RepID=UPI0025C47C67|nr:HXXEE domain-containing protein [Magnetospirillum sp. 64-120]MBI2239825.1 HXXEE domain-containing protein [Magnetospirillum gryphiswaldense]